MTMKTHWNKTAPGMGKASTPKRMKKVSQSKYNMNSNPTKSTKAGPKSGC